MRITRFFLRKFSTLKKRYVCKKALKKYPNIKSAIKEADVSQSTGVDLGDYVALYCLIRKLKPRYVLECGTGKSTYIIAQALLDNYQGKVPQDCKIVSMENQEKWYNDVVKKFPEKYKSFVDIILSETETTHVGFCFGVKYKDVPDLPYDFVFVDGPSPKIGGITTCNMDVVNTIMNSDKKINVLIDNRTSTVAVCNLVLGNKKIRVFPTWDFLARIKDVNKDDVQLLSKAKSLHVFRDPIYVENYTQTPFSY